MKFFKGFVPTKDKKCTVSFKNKSENDLFSYENIKKYDEFAGILSEETILIDIDDSEQSEILMDMVEDMQLNCRVYQTTRGKHFLFKNAGVNKCYTHVKLACGLTADIKVGCKNSYEILKINGEERFIEWDEDGEPDIIPMFLKPIKTKISFLELDEGDGRNQQLFNYILNLQSAGFTVDEARETLRIINRYVLKQSLTEDELDVIMRDEAFQKPVFYDEKGRFCHDKFANYLISSNHIKMINGQMHAYTDGVYVTGQRILEHLMIQQIPNLTRAKRAEVLAYLDSTLIDDTDASPAEKIVFNNGVYDLRTGEFTQYDPDVVVTNKIPWDYNPSAYFELTDQILNNIACHDPDIRQLIEEMVGSCLYRSNSLAGGKAFILTGTGANGKSTLLDMLKTMLGKKNVSVLDLKKLNDRFSTIMMFNKLANIGDDISEEFLSDTAEFKKVVTGQMLDAEQKGQPKFNFEPYCKLIFSANNIPRIGKGRDSGAIMRRLVIVPFNAKFTPDSPDYRPFIGAELQTEESMEYMIQIGLKGLKRVLETKGYTTSEAMQTELQEYEESNNPIIGFFREVDNGEYHIEDEVTAVVYRQYNEWCLSNSLQPLSNGEFSKQVKKHYGLKIIDKKRDGKKRRIFQR